MADGTAGRGVAGISLGGILVIVGIVVAIVWSVWIGIIVALIGLLAFGGFGPRSLVLGVGPGRGNCGTRSGGADRSTRPMGQSPVRRCPLGPRVAERLDEERLEILRTWGAGLSASGRDELRAAGKAIVMLIDEIDRLQADVWMAARRRCSARASRPPWRRRPRAEPEPEPAERRRRLRGSDRRPQRSR